MIRWKRLRDFYCDLQCEHESVFRIDGNLILNAGTSAGAATDPSE